MSKEKLLTSLKNLTFELEDLRKRLESIEQEVDYLGIPEMPKPAAPKFHRGYLVVEHKTDQYWDIIDLEKVQFIRAMVKYRPQGETDMVEATIGFTHGESRRCFMTIQGFQKFQQYLLDRIPMTTVEGYDDPPRQQEPDPLTEVLGQGTFSVPVYDAGVVAKSLSKEIKRNKLSAIASLRKRTKNGQFKPSKKVKK